MFCPSLHSLQICAQKMDFQDEIGHPKLENVCLKFNTNLGFTFVRQLPKIVRQLTSQNARGRSSPLETDYAVWFLFSYYFIIIYPQTLF